MKWLFWAEESIHIMWKWPLNDHPDPHYTLALTFSSKTALCNAFRTFSSSRILASRFRMVSAWSAMVLSRETIFASRSAKVDRRWSMVIWWSLIRSWSSLVRAVNSVISPLQEVTCSSRTRTDSLKSAMDFLFSSSSSSKRSTFRCRRECYIVKSQNMATSTPHKHTCIYPLWQVSISCLIDTIISVIHEESKGNLAVIDQNKVPEETFPSQHV